MLIKNYQNQEIEINIDTNIDVNNLICLPALIDPHVHFRTPGHEYKENWQTASQAALAGGVTTVFDMPNNNPAVTNQASLINKKKTIDQQLQTTNIPLHYYLYFGATPNNQTEYNQLKKEVIGIKMFMGSSTGNLLVDKKEDQAKIFQTATANNLIVAVHAEDNEIIKQNQKQIKQPTITDHSQIRNRQAAVKAVNQAIELAKKYGSKLYICHLSTKEEIEIITQAKKNGLNIYAEVTPHHLFLTENDYEQWGTKVQMNPPLRTQADQNALWQAIKDGIIDTIGTDHASHTLEEKNRPYGKAPSGVPGIETYLPLLLDAHNQGKISLEKIVDLTNRNITKIFNLQTNDDLVLIDLNLTKKVKDENLKTKCGWSPFSGRKLKGWPVYTILNNKLYKI